MKEDSTTIPHSGSMHATPEATAAFALRHQEIADTYHELGSTGLTCSAIGFGSYRVDVRVASHRASLAAAIRKGVNLIDTSSNYADGNSELLVGEVMKGIVTHGVAKREEIIIVSKGGYIQGQNYKRLRQMLEESGEAAPAPGSELAELVQYGQDLWHSIHPDFLKDQITRSLERLQIETIDVYLLHNPEYYIQWAIKDNIPEDEAREEYERRIKKAFTYLEEEVRSGRISFYGISSNTFPKPEESVDRTSLERCWKSAEEIKQELKLDRHHFAVIQLPLNIFEHGAVTEKNQNRSTQSTIEFAREKNIGVLINRPLNAIVNRDLYRLADFPLREHPPAEEIDDLVHDLSLQEQEFKEGLLKDIALNPQAYDAVKQFLSLGKHLDKQWRGFHSYEEWRDIATTILSPRIHYCFDALRPISNTNKEVYNFLVEYAESADELMEHINNYYSSEANRRATAIHRVLNALIPADLHGASLSQKAVMMDRSVPGVSSVLVGMRTEEYVDDMIFGLQAPELQNAEELWSRLEIKNENQNS